MSIETLRVELGPRSYDIRIGEGLIAAAGAEIAPLLRRPRVAIVTETTVAGLHLPALLAALEGQGIDAATLTLAPGEGTKRDRAKAVGQAIAKACLEKGITQVVFDRNGYIYHGRVSALADGAREGGLDF